MKLKMEHFALGFLCWFLIVGVIGGVYLLINNITEQILTYLLYSCIGFAGLIVTIGLFGITGIICDKLLINKKE